jgi:hypothetical protein
VKVTRVCHLVADSQNIDQNRKQPYFKLCQYAARRQWARTRNNVTEAAPSARGSSWQSASILAYEKTNSSLFTVTVQSSGSSVPEGKTQNRSYFETAHRPFPISYPERSSSFPCRAAACNKMHDDRSESKQSDVQRQQSEKRNKSRRARAAPAVAAAAAASVCAAPDADTDSSRKTGR